MDMCKNNPVSTKKYSIKHLVFAISYKAEKTAVFAYNSKYRIFLTRTATMTHTKKSTSENIDLFFAHYFNPV